MISTLIDKQDNFEIIRDQIAAILAAEVINQMALATAAAKEPDDWKLRIFTERSNPFEEWLDFNDQTDKSPIINVWFDNSKFDLSASNVAERQKSGGVFNIDCYGLGISSDNPGGGHNPGDKDGALEVQKALRLARNILMAAENTYLQLRGLVWTRMPQSIVAFQPEISGQQIQQVSGARLALNVEFSEFSPQVPEETLDYVAIDVKRAENGEIAVEADYNFGLGASLDGTNDYLTRGSDLDGNADGDEFTIAVRFRVNADGIPQCLLNNSNNRILLLTGTDNRWQILARNSTGDIVLNQKSDVGQAITADVNYHTILVSAKLSAIADGQIYIDDSGLDIVTTLIEGETIEFTRPEHSIGATITAASKLNGDIAAIGLWYKYYDLDIEANRRKFFNADGTFAINNGNSSDGIVDAVIPIIWQAGAFDQWENNKGSGGGFTVNGALSRPLP